MPLTLTHTHDSHLDVAHGEGGAKPLFRYVYEPRTDPFETPKPYLHPVRTLAGNVVTVFRPHDHLWHYGMAMTFAHVNGQNFWGGNCYVHGEGYKRLPHLVGVQEHRSWDGVHAGKDGIRLAERVTWKSFEGEAWVDDTRSLTVPDVAEGADHWSFEYATTLTNAAPRPLHIGSPTTAGRPNAGYGGFFWRGPRSFLNGEILAAGGLSGPEVMGQRAPWVAYIGRHDGTDGPAAAASTTVSRSTLVFVDHPDNPRYPTKWFVRNEPYGCVSFALTFDEELTLEPGQSISLKNRVLIADGAWDAAKIEQNA
jgi:hypothetical protein